MDIWEWAFGKETGVDKKRLKTIHKLYCRDACPVWTLISGLMSIESIDSKAWMNRLRCKHVKAGSELGKDDE